MRARSTTSQPPGYMIGKETPRSLLFPFKFIAMNIFSNIFKSKTTAQSKPVVTEFRINEVNLSDDSYFNSLCGDISNEIKRKDTRNEVKVFNGDVVRARMTSQAAYFAYSREGRKYNYSNL